MKDNLILHHDTLSVINELSDEQAGKLIKEIYDYSVYINNPKEAKKPTGLNGLLNSVAHPFKMQLDRDLVSYSKIVEKNSKNGLKGGRPKKEETQKKPTKPKKADSDKESDSDNNTKELNPYDDFLAQLSKACKYKTKVTKTKDGAKVFKTIQDKQKLFSDYIQHQLDKENYAIRITEFMKDYETVHSQTQIEKASNPYGY